MWSRLRLFLATFDTRAGRAVEACVGKEIRAVTYADRQLRKEELSPGRFFLSQGGFVSPFSEPLNATNSYQWTLQILNCKLVFHRRSFMCWNWQFRSWFVPRVCFVLLSLPRLTDLKRRKQGMTPCRTSCCMLCWCSISSCFYA